MISELSKEKELSRITMVDIGEKAGIRVDVLKHSDTSVEKILSFYAVSVDYCILDMLDFKHPMWMSNEAVLKDAFINLIKLYNLLIFSLLSIFSSLAVCQVMFSSIPHFLTTTFIPFFTMFISRKSKNSTIFAKVAGCEKRKYSLLNTTKPKTLI